MNARSAEFGELLLACRRGDMSMVQRYVAREVPLNQVDEWNYSPLILASLCGHADVVTYLLEHGAICERNTYEGERCIYGALTDKIKKILINSSVKKGSDLKQPFFIFLNSLYTKGKNADICFKLIKPNGLTYNYYAHRFILSFSSDYFTERLVGYSAEWRHKSYVEILIDDPHYDHKVYEYLFNILYSNAYISNIRDQNIRELTIKYRLHDIQEDIFEITKVTSKKDLNTEVNTLQQKLNSNMITKLDNFFQNRILNHCIKVNTSRNDYDEYEDFTKLFEENLTTEMKIDLLYNSSVPDVIIATIDVDGTIIYYPVHKVMLLRSDYFQAFFEIVSGELSSDFIEDMNNGSETDEDKGDGNDSNKDKEVGVKEKVEFKDWTKMSENPNNLRVIPFVFSRLHECNETVLRHLYTDATTMKSELAIDVLLLAEALMIDKLKTAAALEITRDLDFTKTGYSIYDILRIAWQTKMTRIEHYVAQVFALNIREYLIEPEFSELVIESSERIQERQETDTVELIDDVRYFLTNWKYGINFGDETNVPSDLEEVPKEKSCYNNKSNSNSSQMIHNYYQYCADMTALDNFLEDLGFDF